MLVGKTDGEEVEFPDDDAKVDMSIVDIEHMEYKQAAFSVEHPESTFITLEKALEYCGDNSTYSKRCLYVLSLLWLLNGFLATGWPLYFDGNTLKCTDQSGDSYSCNTAQACQLRSSQVEILGHATITQEFGLICGKANWVPFFSTVYFLGMVMSGFIFPIWSDIRGRRISLLFAIVCNGISMLGLSLSPNVLALAALFGFAGFSQAAIEVVGIVYRSEISGPNFRIHSMVFLTLFYGFSQVVLGFLYTTIDYWRYIFAYIIAAPCLVCFICAYIIFDESPSYLVSKHAFQDAKKVLKRMAEVNKRRPFKFLLAKEIPIHNQKYFCIKKGKGIAKPVVSDSPSKQQKSELKGNKKFNFLFASDHKMTTGLMMILWLTRFYAYFGLQFGVEELGKSILLNFTILGIAEVLASALSSPITKKYPRKYSMAVCLLICGLSCFLSKVFPYPTIMAIVSKFSISIYYNILLNYTTEIYPTEVRSQATGFLMTVGRVSLLIMQWSFNLWYNYTGYLSYHLIGVITFLGGFAIYGLEETFQKELDEVEEGGNQQRTSVKQKARGDRISGTHELKRPLMYQDYGDGSLHRSSMYGK